MFRLISVSWEDLTGIYKIKKYLQQEIRILVMPHSYELGTMNDRLKKMNSCEQGFEYDGVRKYREGDRLSRIHWNLYATSRDLWVRKNEDEAQESVKIAISLKDINKDRISDYFAVVYSVLLFYMNPCLFTFYNSVFNCFKKYIFYILWYHIIASIKICVSFRHGYQCNRSSWTDPKL